MGQEVRVARVCLVIGIVVVTSIGMVAVTSKNRPDYPPCPPFQHSLLMIKSLLSPGVILEANYMKL